MRLGGSLKADPKYMVFLSIYTRIARKQSHRLSSQGRLRGRQGWRRAGSSVARGTAPRWWRMPPVKGRVLEPDYLGLHPRHKIDQPGNPEQSLPLFVLSYLVYNIGIRWAWPPRIVVEWNEIIPINLYAQHMAYVLHYYQMRILKGRLRARAGESQWKELSR